MALEFDVQRFNLHDTCLQAADNKSFRLVDQGLVDTTLHFFINGYCHGQKVLQHDLHFQLHGKKIIKSIQQRLLDYKDYLTK